MLLIMNISTQHPNFGNPFGYQGDEAWIVKDSKRSS